MADFDWATTLDAVLATGHVCGVVAMDTDGNVWDAKPLSEDGGYPYYVWGGENAYEQEVTQEDGSTKSESIDEVAGLLTLVAGSHPPGKGLYLNGEKYMVLRPLDAATYAAPVSEDETYNVTIDKVYNLKKGSTGAVVASKGGYIFVGFCDNSDPAQQPPDAALALSVAMYWTVGPDPEE